jgi:hypothetical protein
LNGLDNVAEFTIQHGSMPALSVRYLREGYDVDEVIQPHIEWLSADLDNSFPLVGLDAETGVHGVRLLQISTRARCLLVRLPLQVHLTLYSHRATSLSPSFPFLHLASPLVNLLASRTIYKSGAELWGDALDLYRDLHVHMNGCLNMSYIHRRGPYSLSLEAMTNRILGQDAFIKDKDTTLSDWDANKLTFRQLIYGALDAQASYIVGSDGHRPTAFHTVDMSRQWLDNAGHWFLQYKYMQRESEQAKLELAFDTVEISPDGTTIRLIMRHGTGAARLKTERWLYLHWADQVEELWYVDGLSGREVVLRFKSPPDAMQNQNNYLHLVPSELLKLSLRHERDADSLSAPIRQYLSRMMHDIEPFNPFIASILDLPFVVKTYTSHGSARHGSSQLHFDNRRQSLTDNGVSASSDASNSLVSALDYSKSHNSFLGTPQSSPFLSSHTGHPMVFNESPHLFSLNYTHWWLEDDLPVDEAADEKLSQSFAHLNDAQRAALQLVDTSRVTSISGPPGTGKSY